MADAGGKPGRIRRAGTEARVEAEEAQDAQIVFPDALRRGADEDDSLSQTVTVSICKVIYFPRLVAVERVHGEVAPLGVGLPVVRELHPGAAAIRLDVMAERGDFVGRVIGDHRDGAVVDAGRMNGKASGLAGPRDRVGRERGGEIDLGDRQTHDGIAHGSTRHPRLAARRADGGEDALQRRSAKPSGADSRRRGRHGSP